LRNLIAELTDHPVFSCEKKREEHHEHDDHSNGKNERSGVVEAKVPEETEERPAQMM
jgi:hypothetical protein